MAAYLKLGDIKGECMDENHTDWIDVLAWSWGAQQAGNTHKGGGGGVGRMTAGDVQFTTHVGKHSALLLQDLCSGKHIPQAELVLRKAGDKPMDYLRYKFKDILITNYNIGGSGGEEQLTDSFTMNFAEFEKSYKPQKADGSADAEIKAGWDLKANKTKV